MLKLKGSVFLVGLSYGARNVLPHTRHMMQNFLALGDSPIIPLRRSHDDSELHVCHESDEIRNRFR